MMFTSPETVGIGVAICSHLDSHISFLPFSPALRKDCELIAGSQRQSLVSNNICLETYADIAEISSDVPLFLPVSSFWVRELLPLGCGGYYSGGYVSVAIFGRFF